MDQAASAEDPAAALAEWAAKPAVQPDLVSRQVTNSRRTTSQGPGALIWALPAAVRRLDADRIRELVALAHGEGSPAADAVIMLAEHLFTPDQLDPPDTDPCTAVGALARRFLVREPEPKQDNGKLRGCLIGWAVGDALGANTENFPMEVVHEWHGPDGITDVLEPCNTSTSDGCTPRRRRGRRPAVHSG